MTAPRKSAAKTALGAFFALVLGTASAQATTRPSS